MLYTNLYRGKVKHVEFEDDGEQYDFYLKKPKAVLMIRRADEQADKKKTGVKINQEMVGEIVVNEDGSAITKEQVEGIMEMESSAFSRLSELILEVMGTTKKKDDEKNA